MNTSECENRCALSPEHISSFTPFEGYEMICKQSAYLIQNLEGLYREFAVGVRWTNKVFQALPFDTADDAWDEIVRMAKRECISPKNFRVVGVTAEVYEV